MTSPVACLVLAIRSLGDRLSRLEPLFRGIRELDPRATCLVSAHYRVEIDALAVIVQPLEASFLSDELIKKILTAGAGLGARPIRTKSIEAARQMIQRFEISVDVGGDPADAVQRIVPAIEVVREGRPNGDAAAAPERSISAVLDLDDERIGGVVASLTRSECFVEYTEPLPPLKAPCRVSLTDGVDTSEHRAFVSSHVKGEQALAEGQRTGFSLRLLSVENAGYEIVDRFIAIVQLAARAQTDRRPMRRLAASLNVALQSADDVQDVITENVNLGGVFVATNSPPAPGTQLKVSITLPGRKEPVQLLAEVRHVVTEEAAARAGRKAGAGLRFVDPPDQVSELLRRYLDEVVTRRGAQMLVVDDDPFFLELCMEQLGAAGYQVMPAADGETALRRLQDELVIVDLVILDVEMPGLNGVQVIQQIRESRSAADLPILMVSSSTLAPVEQEVIRGLGAIDVLQKGDGLVETLLATVDRVLNRQL